MQLYKTAELDPNENYIIGLVLCSIFQTWNQQFMYVRVVGVILMAFYRLVYGDRSFWPTSYSPASYLGLAHWGSISKYRFSAISDYCLVWRSLNLYIFHVCFARVISFRRNRRQQREHYILSDENWQRQRRWNCRWRSRGGLRRETGRPGFEIEGPQRLHQDGHTNRVTFSTKLSWFHVL